MDNIHKGHRDRLRRRFREEGLTHFEDLHILELMLFHALPRRDTSPVAHALLKQFGSLAGVLDARTEDLMQVAGISENAALYLRMFPQVMQRYLHEQSAIGNILADTAQCGRYLLSCYFQEREEVVYLLCLDAKCKLLDCSLIHRGSVNSASVSVRKIVEQALRCNATSVVLSHNHVSGVALPSQEDLSTTQQLKTALDAVGITLTDHIIVAGDDFVSLRDTGCFT
ncbi:MAG: DNA repair protein RadC [Oscillospiraceae bacterium]|nr:DNA repair protein RadC [Oscillospiraceae bacterium]MBR2366012.1 DNA repair protein RadC [Oscillospiraceae bacterium]MBR2896695.1 DNA repair protein RadC [Oscillospiraceae bacterium]MBR2976943.1 DNA repair protein RadC [Oscillospiraceae bacterium]MBR3850397.1 DNA repair protein RadC [Oscillospiraceae bacterium]